jgi:hypothetical protein
MFRKQSNLSSVMYDNQDSFSGADTALSAALRPHTAVVKLVGSYPNSLEGDSLGRKDRRMEKLSMHSVLITTSNYTFFAFIDIFTLPE